MEDRSADNDAAKADMRHDTFPEGGERLVEAFRSFWSRPFASLRHLRTSAELAAGVVLTPSDPLFASIPHVSRPLSDNSTEALEKSISAHLREEAVLSKSSASERLGRTSPSLSERSLGPSCTSPFRWYCGFGAPSSPARNFSVAGWCLGSVLFSVRRCFSKTLSLLIYAALPYLAVVTLLSSVGAESVHLAVGGTAPKPGARGLSFSPLAVRDWRVTGSAGRGRREGHSRKRKLWNRKKERDQPDETRDGSATDAVTRRSCRVPFSPDASLKNLVIYRPTETTDPEPCVLPVWFISSWLSPLHFSPCMRTCSRPSSPLHFSQGPVRSSSAALPTSRFSSRSFLPRGVASALKQSPGASSSPQHKKEETKEAEDVELLLAKPRGFCAGVSRAIGIVEEALRIWGPPVYVKHSIVHNEVVCDDLRAKGAIFVEEIKDIPHGSVAIFSAHGVSPAVRAEADARDLRVVDATCPLVTKVHVYVKQKAEQGYQIVLIGHKDHVEVVGTKGEAPDAVTVVENVGDVEALSFPPTTKLFYATQTTLSLDDCAVIKAALIRKYPRIESIPSGSVCYATTNRQTAFQKLAPSSDLAIVVGSSASSNARRLVETAANRGVKAYLVNHPDMIDPSWLKGVKKVALTSSASTPEVTTAQVAARLQALGVNSVTEYEGVLERVPFWKFPRNLQEAGKQNQEKKGVATPL